MPALRAAIGSFHVKSATTYFVMVLVTVRVLPFFLTVVLIRSVTLFVSTLGVRSYSDQRYSSMQMSTTRHSSSVSTGRAAACGSSSTGSGLNRDTSRTRVSGGGVGREAGEGGFARAWIDRRRIVKHGRGYDGRLGRLAIGRRHSGHGGHCVCQQRADRRGVSARNRSAACRPAVPDRLRGILDAGPLEAAEPRSAPPGNSDRCAQQHQRKTAAVSPSHASPRSATVRHAAQPAYDRID